MGHATKGMSHAGPTVPVGEVGTRWVETMAAENIAEVARQATDGAPMTVGGGSLNLVHRRL